MRDSGLLCQFSLGGNFAFDIFESIASIGVEVWVSECPVMFAKLNIVGVFHLVEVILVKLSHKTGKI